MHLPYYRTRLRKSKAAKVNLQLAVRKSKLCSKDSIWKHVVLRNPFLQWSKNTKLFLRQVTLSYKGCGALYLLYDLQKDKHALVTENYGGRNLSNLLIHGEAVTDKRTVEKIQSAFFNVATSVSNETASTIDVARW